MTKVQLIGHLRHLDPTLDVLYRIGCVHLVDVLDAGLAPLTVDDRRTRERERLRILRARLDAFLTLVDPPEGNPVALTSARLDRVEREIEVVAPEVERLGRTADELQNELELLPRYISLLEKLLPLVPEPDADMETAALLLDRRHGSALGDLHAELASICGPQFDLLSAPIDDTSLGTILLYPHACATDVADLLGRSQVSRVRLPQRFASMPLRDAMAAMHRRQAELPTLLHGVEQERADLLRPYAEWPATRTAIAARLRQFAAIQQLGTTRSTFVVRGWVPRRELDRLQAELGEEIAIEEVMAAEADAAPVLLDNPEAARPFEFLVRLLGVPRAGSLDPTRLMALFLPLFFGIMLGDVAYGLLLLGLATWLRRRFPKLADLFRVLQYGAAWAAVWGVVYGEFLGDLGHRLFGWRPLWINREEAIVPLLRFALAIGAAHVTLGIVLGIYTSVRARRHHETAERIGMLVALSALFVLVAVVAKLLPPGFMTPGVAVLIVALVLLFALQGLLAPLHLIGAIGNVLSYLRLAAIGLASVYLARVANELAVTAPLIVGILVATLFHALNLVLGAFSPTIQALRLHYVEFFPNFHESGGQPFEPFGKR